MSQSTTTAQPARPRWGMQQCGYYANAGMVAAAKGMLPLAYVLVWLGAGYSWVFAGRARRASMAYLEVLQGPGQRPLLRRWWDTFRHFVEYGYLLADRAVMLAKAKHGFRLECAGLGSMAQVGVGGAGATGGGGGPGPGVMLLSAHFGNAEIGIPYLPKMGFDRPIHIVMYHDANDAQERIHARHGKLLANLDIISTRNPVAAGLGIMAALKKGDMVALRADRTLAGKGIEVTLLGRRVFLPAGPFLAAVLTGAPVLYIYTCRLGYRRYSCRFSAVHRYEETSQETREALLARAAQDFASHLESLMREFPFQWSNFYDYWTMQGA